MESETAVSVDVNALLEAIMSGNWVAVTIVAIPVLHLVASVITAATPSATKNPTLDFVLMLLNILALNVGKNVNADLHRRKK